VDFIVADADAAKAADVLAGRGLRVEQPPEDWLFKVFTDGTMVDVIHRASQTPVQRELVEQAKDLEVLSVVMPVLSATEVLIQKLNAMDEHMCDLAGLLPVARALREQVDWSVVRERTAHNHFAAAFLFLLERLDVAPG